VRFFHNFENVFISCLSSFLFKNRKKLYIVSNSITKKAINTKQIYIEQLIKIYSPQKSQKKITKAIRFYKKEYKMRKY